MLRFYWSYSREASTSAHQAVLGRGIMRGCSRCHGKPSSSVASCAALKRTAPSAGDGQQKRPASSRLLYAGWGKATKALAAVTRTLGAEPSR